MEYTGALEQAERHCQHLAELTHREISSSNLFHAQKEILSDYVNHIAVRRH